MQPFAALLCTLAALVSAAALPRQADTALTSLQRREYYGDVLEEGAYFDSALIDYVGTETYEQWVTAQLRPGVYQFLGDFGISREELAEIVQPDIYEQYIRYWPDEELLRGRPGWTQWLWLLGKGANADLASLLPPEEDTAWTDTGSAGGKPRALCCLLPVSWQRGGGGLDSDPGKRLGRGSLEQSLE